MARIPPDLGSLVLKARALGVGENHAHPDGRRYAIEMVNSGLVRALFLEAKNGWQGAFDDAGYLARRKLGSEEPHPLQRTN